MAFDWGVYLGEKLHTERTASAKALEWELV